MPRGNKMDESAKIKALCEMMATCEGFRVNPPAMATFFGVEQTRTIHRKLNTMVQPYGYEVTKGRMRRKEVEAEAEDEDEDEEDDEDEDMEASKAEEEDDDDEEEEDDDEEEEDDDVDDDEMIIKEEEETGEDTQGEEEPVVAVACKEEGELDNEE
ncbi:hypothetical protein LTR23_006765 [Exophiala sp. CCFEE 6169]|nr:hypothetical protein LTR23_006765 [Chaetothyriales sp. CCFEE 6169]